MNHRIASIDFVAALHTFGFAIRHVTADRVTLVGRDGRSIAVPRHKQLERGEVVTLLFMAHVDENAFVTEVLRRRPSGQYAISQGTDAGGNTGISATGTRAKSPEIEAAIAGADVKRRA